MKKVLSIFLTIAMVITMLPTMAFAADAETKTVYTQSDAAESGTGTREAPFKDFEDALKALGPEGGKIVILGKAFQNDTAGGITSSSAPLVINVPVIIEGESTSDGKAASFQIRSGGIVLGADVTMENIELNFENRLHNAIFVNGHSFKATSVTRGSGSREVHLFGGGLKNISAGSGSAAVLTLNNSEFGNIHAGSMSQFGHTEVENYNGSTTITLTNSTVGTIYGSGAKGVQVLPNNFFDKTEPDAPTARKDHTVSGAVTVSMDGASKVGTPPAITVNGNGTANVSMTISEANENKPLNLSDVSSLTVNGGKATIAQINETADVELSKDATIDFAAAKESKDAKTATIASLRGSGKIVLDKEDVLKITGAFDGTHTFETKGGMNGQSGIAATGHAYITAAGGNAEVKFVSNESQKDFLTLNKTTTGSELAWITSDAPKNKNYVEKLEIDVGSKNITKTVSEINNDLGGVGVKIIIGQDDYLENVPLTITVNDSPANYNVDLGAYIVDSMNIALSASDAWEDSPSAGIASINIAKYKGEIAAGTYKFTVSAPKNEDGTEMTTPAAFTLTVTDGSTTSPAVKALTGLEITTQPTKTAYTVGETFDPDGMVVTAKYSDNTEAVIDSTKYTVSPAGILTADDKTITVSYTENGITKTAVVPITVKKKTITREMFKFTAPTTLTYNGTNQSYVILDGVMTKNTDAAIKAPLSFPVKQNGKEVEAINAGEYEVFASCGENETYAASEIKLGTVTIAKKDVTVGPKSVTIKKGDAIPTFELEYSGLVSGEALTAAPAPILVCYETGTTPVAISTPAGTYPITWTNMADTTFSGADNYNVTKSEAGTLTIQSASSGGSSSGGSGGSSSDGGSGSGSSGNSTSGDNTTKTDTVQKPDGSTTTTVTKADGTVTKTTTNPDGSTIVTETKPDGSSKTEQRDANGSVGTIKKDANGETEISAKFSDGAISDAKQDGAAVTAPISVPAEKNSVNAPKIDLSFPKNAGETKVEIPVSNVSSGTVAVLVHPDGTEEIIKNSQPTKDGMQISVNGDATIKIIDNSKDFEDTRNHWSKDEVNYVASRELFAGVGDNRFGVSDAMTRGMVNTVLARLTGVDTTEGATWYEKGTEWAMQNGISDGTNPTANVTREQFAAMLYRYSGSPAVSGTLDFADRHEIEAYAQDALLWAVQKGIISGVGDNCVAPKENAQRAQVAAMLARYMQMEL